MGELLIHCKVTPRNGPGNMSDQTSKRVLLGVSGGIAAYKSPDLVRRLRERGHEVRVVIATSTTSQLLRWLSVCTATASSS